MEIEARRRAQEASHHLSYNDRIKLRRYREPGILEVPEGNDYLGAESTVVDINPGHMAELADALDLGSSGEIREGSNPPMPTTIVRGERLIPSGRRASTHYPILHC